MFPRRRFERYKLMGSALVIFERNRIFNIGKPRINKLGPLSDISQGGLSVEYVANGKRFRNFTELSILVPEYGIAVYRIPFRNISDIVVAEMDANGTIMRRGIQFLELNNQRIAKLNSFIELYAREEVSDRRSGFERRTDNRFENSAAVIPDRRNDLKEDRRRDFYAA